LFSQPCCGDVLSAARGAGAPGTAASPGAGEGPACAVLGSCTPSSSLHGAQRRRDARARHRSAAWNSGRALAPGRGQALSAAGWLGVREGVCAAPATPRAGRFNMTRCSGSQSCQFSFDYLLSSTLKRKIC